MSEPGQVLERDHPRMTAVTNYDSAVIRSLDCDNDSTIVGRDIDGMQAIILDYTSAFQKRKFYMFMMYGDMKG